MKKIQAISLFFVLFISFCLFGCRKEKENTNTMTETTGTTKTLPLVDPNQKIVYDFVYEVANQLPKHTNVQGEEITFPQVIQIPHINLDSEDSKKFNQEMKDFADGLLENYQMAIDGKYNFGIVNHYTFTVHGDIVSILMEQENNHIEGHGRVTLSSFNFNRRTGKEISNQELVKLYGLEDKLDEYVFNRYWNLYDDFRKKNYFLAEEYMAMSLATFWTKYYQTEPFSYLENGAVEQGDKYTPAYYNMAYLDSLYLVVDKENTLNFVADKFYPFTMGSSSHVVAFKANPNDEKAEYKGDEISPIYTYIAKKLKMDPHAEDSPLAFTAYLGNSKQIFKIVNTLTPLVHEVGIGFRDIFPIQVMREEKEKGDFYLVIPKYRATATVFNFYHYYESNGDTDNSFEKYLADKFALGAFLLFTEDTETRPFVTARLQYHQHYADLDFILSGKSGELESVKGTKDISEFLEVYSKQKIEFSKLKKEQEIAKDIIEGALYWEKDSGSKKIAE